MERDLERDDRWRSDESRTASLANLVPIENAERARQLGRYSGESRRANAAFREELIRQLGAKVRRDPKGRTVLQKLVAVVLDRALRGDIFAARTIFERVDGRVLDGEDVLMPSRVFVQVNRNVVRFSEAQGTGKGDGIRSEAVSPLSGREADSSARPG